MINVAKGAVNVDGMRLSKLSLAMSTMYDEPTSNKDEKENLI